MAFGCIKHKLRKKKINGVVSTRVLGIVRDLNLSLIIIYSTYFTAFKVQLTFGVVPLSLKAQSYGFANTNSYSI